jgi:hypothetical protein
VREHGAGSQEHGVRMRDAFCRMEWGKMVLGWLS